MRAAARILLLTATVCVFDTTSAAETAKANAANDVRLNPRAVALLEKAAARNQAKDYAGALQTYIEAVKIDGAAADLGRIREFGSPTFRLTSDPEDEKRVAAARPLEIAALRQYLRLHPRDWEATKLLLERVEKLEDAESLIAEELASRPRDPEVYGARAKVRGRFGEHSAALEDWRHAAKLDPRNAEGHYVVGVVSYTSVREQPNLTDSEKRDRLESGLAALERAEKLRDGYYESLVYRSLMLRELAALEKDPARQKKLIAEADAVRQRALLLRTKSQ